MKTCQSGKGRATNPHTAIHCCLVTWLPFFQLRTSSSSLLPPSLPPSSIPQHSPSPELLCEVHPPRCVCSTHSLCPSHPLPPQVLHPWTMLTLCSPGRHVALLLPPSTASQEHLQTHPQGPSQLPGTIWDGSGVRSPIGDFE